MCVFLCVCVCVCMIHTKDKIKKDPKQIGCVGADQIQSSDRLLNAM